MKVCKVCTECGRSNERVRLSSEFERVLCDSCIKRFKNFPFKYIPPSGEVHYDEVGNIICHMCGRSFKSLGPHITTFHKISIDKYREKFELNRTQSLLSKGSVPIYRHNAFKFGIENLEKHRITYQPGNQVNKGKKRRKQCINKRMGMKYKSEGELNGI